METCDVVDKLGNRTGQVVIRGTELAPGEYYLVVHVWIRDESGNYLIQQRALNLASDPGIWTTTTGYVLAGEESIAGAMREAKEELGIQLSPTRLRKLDRHTMDNRVEDIWLADVLHNPIQVSILEAEVADWKWVSRDELEQMMELGDFFRYSYFGNLPK